MRSGIALVLMVALAGCVPEGARQQTELEASRALARRAVNAVFESRLPGVDAAQVTDCVIDNAQSDELLVLARTAGTSLIGTPDYDSAWPVIQTVVRRPDTLRCLAGATSAMDLLGPGLLMR